MTTNISPGQTVREEASMNLFEKLGARAIDATGFAYYYGRLDETTTKGYMLTAGSKLVLQFVDVWREYAKATDFTNEFIAVQRCYDEFMAKQRSEGAAQEPPARPVILVGMPDDYCVYRTGQSFTLYRKRSNGEWIYCDTFTATDGIVEAVKAGVYADTLGF